MLGKLLGVLLVFLLASLFALSSITLGSCCSISGCGLALLGILASFRLSRSGLGLVLRCGSGPSRTNILTEPADEHVPTEGIGVRGNVGNLGTKSRELLSVVFGGLLAAEPHILSQLLLDFLDHILYLSLIVLLL